MFRRSASEMRVVIVAPFGRDGALLASSLAPLNVDRTLASDPDSFIHALNDGVGCAVIAEEALTPRSIDEIKMWLAQQPPWSDMPFIILTFSGRATRQSQQRAEQYQALGNVTFLERPVRPDTAQSSVRSALRARLRQYEIRSRQEELLQANADLEQFAHSASHDLREPLRSISIYSDLIARTCPNTLDQRGVEFLSVIRSSARRMDALLDDLLSYAHASSISEEVLEPVSSLGPLEAALSNLAGAIQESEANITVGDLPQVRMRESHLSQLFQNLIGNAIQAYKDTIFGIFQRLHSAGQYNGTGMGLAICKRIVERYGGRIWVESEPGGGSKFLFSARA